MNWLYIVITDVWAEQSTIQRLFHVLYSFIPDKLIGTSSAIKVNFQRTKSSPSLWLAGSGCVVWLHYLDHLLAGHNCARTRCDVYSCSHASLAFHLCISVEYENALTLWALLLPHAHALVHTRGQRRTAEPAHTQTQSFTLLYCAFLVSVSEMEWLFERLKK